MVSLIEQVTERYRDVSPTYNLSKDFLTKEIKTRLFFSVKEWVDDFYKFDLKNPQFPRLTYEVTFLELMWRLSEILGYPDEVLRGVSWSRWFSSYSVLYDFKRYLENEFDLIDFKVEVSVSTSQLTRFGILPNLKWTIELPLKGQGSYKSLGLYEFSKGVEQVREDTYLCLKRQFMTVFKDILDKEGNKPFILCEVKSHEVLKASSFWDTGIYIPSLLPYLPSAEWVYKRFTEDFGLNDFGIATQQTKSGRRVGAYYLYNAEGNSLNATSIESFSGSKVKGRLESAYLTSEVFNPLRKEFSSHFKVYLVFALMFLCSTALMEDSFLFGVVSPPIFVSSLLVLLGLGVLWDSLRYIRQVEKVSEGIRKVVSTPERVHDLWKDSRAPMGTSFWVLLFLTCLWSLRAISESYQNLLPVLPESVFLLLVFAFGGLPFYLANYFERLE